MTFQAVHQVRTDAIVDPELIDDRDAIVRVSMAGLCGSDLHPFHGREQGILPGTVMGHELVGTVEAVGSGVPADRISVGDRVFAPFSTNCGDCYFCQSGLTSRCEHGQLFGWKESQGGEIVGLEGCQSEWVRVPYADASLKRLPDGVSDEAALLLGDNFSTGYYCAELASLQPSQVAAVVGCGTVGQLCILAARTMGVETIIAIDLVESRRKQAEALGAIPATPDSAWAEVSAKTRGRGADAVMELVGMPAAQKLAFELIRPGGTMAVIGCHCTPGFAFSPADAYDKNLTYRTGRCPARHYMDLLTQRVANGEFDLDAFVTNYFSFDDSVKAYDIFSNRRDNCIKAVFVPG